MHSYLHPFSKILDNISISRFWFGLVCKSPRVLYLVVHIVFKKLIWQKECKRKAFALIVAARVVPWKSKVQVLVEGCAECRIAC